MILWRYGDTENDSNDAENNKLQEILSTIDIGGQVTSLIFSQGWKSVFNAAITSRASWKTISTNAVSGHLHGMHIRHLANLMSWKENVGFLCFRFED
jgi:hypothetical protein